MVKVFLLPCRCAPYVLLIFTSTILTKALLTAEAYQKCLTPVGAYIPNRSACVPVRANLNSFPTCL